MIISFIGHSFINRDEKIKQAVKNEIQKTTLKAILSHVISVLAVDSMRFVLPPAKSLKTNAYRSNVFTFRPT